MSPMRAFLAVAVFVGLLPNWEALADDKCADCPNQYDLLAAACESEPLTSESRALCYARARSNLEACNNRCSSSNDESGN